MNRSMVLSKLVFLKPIIPNNKCTLPIQPNEPKEAYMGRSMLCFINI